MKRTFIAIDIPLATAIKQALAKCKHMLGNAARIKWVDEKSLHITLAFIGETHEQQIYKIDSHLKNTLQSLPKTSIELRGAGVFKNIYNPKAIWLGVGENAVITSIQLKVSELLSTYGYIPDYKLFKPHVTIGRVRMVTDKQILKDFVVAFQDKLIDTVAIDKVVFYESILRPDGPEYKHINIYGLSHPPAPDDGKDGVD